MKRVKKYKPALWTTLKPKVKKSDRKAAYRKRAREFVKEAQRRGELCPVVGAIPELANGWAYGHRISARITEVHHMRGRAGSLLMDERHWMGVSKLGHRFIHEHPETARVHGWMCCKGLWNTPDKS